MERVDMAAGRIYNPVNEPCAWRGEDLQRSTVWMTQLSEGHIAEINEALAAVKARGLAMEDITAADFALPSLGAELLSLAKELESGRGFVLIRGLPVDRLGHEDAKIAYWGLSVYLGDPVSQNRMGELMTPVQDSGKPASDLNVRGPLTNARLYYHSDFTDIVGLMCLHPAKEGGISRICSSIAIYNTLVKMGRTDLIDALYDGYYFDRKGEEAPDEPAVSERPIPMLGWHNQKLSFRYFPKWAESAVERSGVPWSSTQREAVDEINRLSNLPEYYLDMNFQVGDIQFLNNYGVLHSRTAFTDYPEAERKRLLHRVWLKAHLGRELTPEFDNLFGGKPTRDGIPPWQSQ